MAGDCTVDDASMTGLRVVDLERTDEMPVVRTVEARVGGDEEGDSDVFLCRPTTTDLRPTAALGIPEPVTLFVYGWDNVEPGPLSWAFPSLRTALDAVRTMRNAVAWSIVSGETWESIEAARDEGAVLVEQSA
jgi:hypothetical protein